MARARGTTPLPPFERVLEEHGPAVLRLCVARAGRERGEDCFQEAMLAALRAYPGLRDPDAVEAWLLAIAARKVLDAHRARARAPEPTDAVASLAGADDGAGRDEALWSQVRTLPAKQRQAVTLRFLADLTHAEIAGVMGTTEPAARRNLHEGLRRLRRESER